MTPAQLEILKREATLGAGKAKEQTGLRARLTAHTLREICQCH
jgi:hypothetical protein